MNPVRTRIVLASFGICFIGMLMSAVLAPVEAANPKISVSVGQSVTQRVATTIKTVSIADSDVADVVVAGPREILVNGKKVGFTTLVVEAGTVIKLRASNLGCPVTLSKTAGVTARAYNDAARRLNGEEVEMIVPTDKKGLLVKLFGGRAA